MQEEPHDYNDLICSSFGCEQPAKSGVQGKPLLEQSSCGSRKAMVALARVSVVRLGMAAGARGKGASREHANTSPVIAFRTWGNS